MSVVSDLFKKLASSSVLEGAVRYLETVDIPGPKRKELAVGIVKLLHVSGPWDNVVENVVSGAIEYVLADIRQYALKYEYDHFHTYNGPAVGTGLPAAPDTMAGKYDSWHQGTLPTDQILLDMGFKKGDGKYSMVIEGVAHWTVARIGGVHNGTYEGNVG